MNKRLLFSALALVLAAGFTAMAAKDGDVVGWITDSHCAAQGAKEGHGACATKCVKEQNAKYVLYSPSDKKAYQLDAQDKAAAMAGKHVKVSGAVEGEMIKVKAIEPTGEQKGAEKQKKS